MAFDPENHAIDPVTGYHIHKEDGRRVGIDPAPFKRVTDETEYPKWIEPHPGHIKHHAIHGYPTAPEWGEMHMGRDGVVKVVVSNADEEARALADPNPASEAV